MLKRLTMIAAVGAVTTALSTAAVFAEPTRYRAAPAQTPGSPVLTVFYNNLGKYIEEESGGDIALDVVGMEIVGLKEMKNALNSGLANIGNVLPAFFRADLPNFMMMGDVAMLASETISVSGAMTEYIVNCADCQAEFKKFGIVYTGSVSTEPFWILTKTPVVEAEDLKGLRLRTPSPPYARFVQSAGAIAVNAPPTEAFEQMSQGLIDGEIASVVDLTAYRLVDVVTDVTKIPLGLYYTTIPAAVSTDTWDEWSVEQRRALIEASVRAGADMNEEWGYLAPNKAIEAGEEAGINFLEPGETLTKFADDFVEADLPVALEAAKKAGITEVDEKIVEFRRLLEKWEGIIDEIGTDPEKVAERMNTEIWDNVDLATYGQ